MASRAVFSFADKGFHGAGSRGGQTENLPEGLAKVIRTQDVRLLTWTAIGPGDRWYIAWKDAWGERHMCTSHFDPAFDLWLESIVTGDEISQTRVFLGPNKAIFAHSPKLGSWHRFPGYEDLEAEFKSRCVNGTFVQDPEIVAMGKNGAWVVVGQKGDFVWNLRGKYANLEKKLKEVNFGIQHVALSSWDDRDYLVTFTDGSGQWTNNSCPDITFLDRV